jgi:hypothetical protein
MLLVKLTLVLIAKTLIIVTVASAQELVSREPCGDGSWKADRE